MPKRNAHASAAPLLLAMVMIAIAIAIAAPAARAVPDPGQFFAAPKSAADYVPDELKNVSVTEHLNSKIPLDLQFVDDEGKTVRIGDYFQGKRPVILQMGYLGCPMLCTLISQGMADSIKQVGLNVGADYEYLFVSIDPNEKPDMAALKKQSYEKDYDRPGTAAGWHFLTGQQPQIKQLADAVGFQYKWVESVHQFSHPAAVMILGPDGKICRYLYGVKFKPTTVRESLVEASNGQIGNTLDKVFLTCFHWDGTQGQYSWFAINLMRIGGLVTVLVVGSVLLFLFRRERLALRHASTQPRVA